MLPTNYICKHGIRFIRFHYYADTTLRCVPAKPDDRRQLNKLEERVRDIRQCMHLHSLLLTEAFI